MADSSPEITKILTDAGCIALLERFVSEKVDGKILLSMADDDMIKLGVATIGDRIRLRESAKLYMNNSISSSQAINTALFPGFRTSSRNSGRNTGRRLDNKKQSGWTATFFCLSSSSQTKTPSTVEKEILNRCGLGLKKIKLNNSFSELEVMSHIESENGFSSLKNCGGFELLRTLANGRNLSSIPSPWTAKDLKLNVGPQARIYIRPIQHDIDTTFIPSETESSVKVACEKCSAQINVHCLREHLNSCCENFITVNDNQNYELSGGQTSIININQSENVPRGETDNIVQTDTTEYVVYYEQVQPNESKDESSEIQTDGVSEHMSTESVLELSDVVISIIQYCKERNISNPIEILRKCQKEIVLGRSLEIEDPDTSVEGRTTYITVDRDNILATSLEEISELTPHDLRYTLEVQFYNEVAADLGGPRKEFFRLVLQEVKEKYFDNGIRDLLQENYYQVGILIALSILQNGKMPVFLNPELVQEVFNEAEPKSSAINYLRQGLNVLGLYDLFVGLPELKYLLQSPNLPLTMKRLTTMLRPKFSEEGSNANRFEKEVYQMFIKYLRELSAGRRGSITLGSVLIFVTSTDEEPALGFKLPPTLVFEEVEEKKFLPKSSTCINQLTLPRGNETEPLPSQELLFNLYDYAFANAHYGLA